MASLNKHLISAYAGYFFRYVYLIVLIPFYARVLGPDSYGLVLAAMSVQSIVWTIQNWGFAFTGARNIASLKTDAERNHEFSRHLTARALLVPIAVAAGIIFIVGSPLLSSHPATASLAVLCGIIAGFNLGWYFQGRLNFTTPVMIEIAGFVITLSMVLFLVRGSADSIYVMASLATSSAITSFIAYFIAAKAEPMRLSSVADGFNLIKQSTPLFITSGTYALMTNVGTYSLATFATPAQVAYFGTAEKVITTGLSLLAPAGQVLLSWFSKMLHENGDTQEVLRQQKRAVKWVCIAGGLATLAALTVAPPLLNLLLGEKFEHASTILMVMSPIFLMAAFNNAISVYIFLPKRMEREISAISIGTTTFGIGLTVVGAWLNGAIGAAIARVIAEMITSVALITLYRYKRTLFQ
ncbi:oligosaccharide flippase family protein [Aquabacterium sp.]|uniref:lipopolysaccharide biosynthesis protein n=1 Tax=Aquabacterium sp. TaxID=1872578 RepID=UPI0019A61331|nr:oligosaccharide flippase family protein [Aquabacterium sp.]MBC7700162.1 oligosaccharide flippase family protein [Aquabacterium sp.]